MIIHPSSVLRSIRPSILQSGWDGADPGSWPFWDLWKQNLSSSAASYLLSGPCATASQENASWGTLFSPHVSHQGPSE